VIPEQRIVMIQLGRRAYGLLTKMERQVFDAAERFEGREPFRETESPAVDQGADGCLLLGLQMARQHAVEPEHVISLHDLLGVYCIVYAKAIAAQIDESDWAA